MKAVSVVTKLCILLALIAFVFPFVTVSCQNEEIATYKGVEMMTGIVFSSEEGSTGEAPDSEAVNPFLIAAAVGGLIALILSFKDYEKVQPVVGAVFALIGAAMLILFRTTFADVYLGEYQDYPLTITFRYGWMISLTALLIAAVGLIGSAAYNILSVRSIEKSHAEDTAARQMTVVCPFCRENILYTQRFCPKCGREQKRDCPWCGAENPILGKVCVNCGKEFPYGQKTVQIPEPPAE